MLDLKTKVWTTKDKQEIPLAGIGNRHLLSIQKFLQKCLANPGYKSFLRSKAELLACDYDSRYHDKDWYIPRSAFADVEATVDDDFNETKVALMLVSEEVRKRRL